MKRYLAQQIYGWVGHGRPIPSWIFHSLIRGSFLDILCVNLLVYMWILWLMYP